MAELILCGIMLLLLIFHSRQMKELTLKKLMFIAILSALSTAGRVAFSAIPSVQPSSFLILSTGVLLGPLAGLMTGLLTGLLSSFWLGLGPWTPWQMFFWGLMGMLVPKDAKRWLLVVIGFVWGFVFRWGMNLWYYADGFAPFTWVGLLTACASSFTFDLAHAITNGALFLAVPLERVRRMLKRHLG